MDQAGCVCYQRLHRCLRWGIAHGPSLVGTTQRRRRLDAIAAPVLGGVSLFGGAGSIGGTLVGAFIIGVLSNGLNLLGIPSYYQQVIKGVVFILAVMLDLFTKRRRV